MPYGVTKNAAVAQTRAAVVDDMRAVGEIRVQLAGFRIDQHDLVEASGGLAALIEQVGVISSQQRATDLPLPLLNSGRSMRNGSTGKF